MPITATGIDISKHRGMYSRILGCGTLAGAVPATGSIPINALNFGCAAVLLLSLTVALFLWDFWSSLPNAKANAVLPPLLWPETASFSMSGLTVSGSTMGRPVDSHSVTRDALLTSSGMEQGMSP